MPDLDIRLFREIAGCSYIRERKNIIFLERSGKRTDRSPGRETVAAFSYSRYDLFVLDKLGYVPFSKEGSELLFQVLAERHEKGLIIITTNLGFADWTQVVGDPVMTAALLDRLIHKAHIINCTWESYRLKQSFKGKRTMPTKGRKTDGNDSA
ncbi:MAG: ATP-binding protein [Deltaproteobacteria bacterium]|nr:ATP-binding protein [Deltaproteobacteria bacterium]